MSSRYRPMSTPAVPWTVAAVLIFGTGVLGSAALAGSFTLLIIGAVLVVSALVYTVALARR